MQFVANGPDVPEALLQAHEDGQVVFFCGAGISYAAGLPLFKGLVQGIFERTGMSMDRLEKSAFDSHQYDVTLDLLEHRHRGGRLVVRRALADALRPKLRRAGATDAHEALLHLARDRAGALRLLTTNFDRIFEVVAKRLKLRHNVFSAPMLPIPKNSRWDGIVYLHGLQPKGSDDPALHRLVVTSGDFGLAYLTERWAARFVTELFRNYVVCFVGYSINDPVLRYMMDALAADRMLGEQTPQAYAFGSCLPGDEAASYDDWKAKGVEAILYTVLTDSRGTQDHSALPRTLLAWARTYRDGTLGKESIVAEHALTNPSESTPQDDFVGRMLWALSHPGGLPAKRFAEMEPVPPLTWLKAFSDDRFCHADLSRFGVPPHAAEDNKLRFSLIRRPAPYQLAPKMAISSNGVMASEWDPVMRHLAQWLARHLNDPGLLLWLVEDGPKPHPMLVWSIDHELNRYLKLESEGKREELDLIRKHSPNAIPGPVMRTLWRIYLAGRVKSSSRELDLFNWMERFNRDGLTSTLRVELRELLSPKIAIRKSWRWSDPEGPVGDREHVRQFIDWELVLAADHVHSNFKDSDGYGSLKAMLPNLLPDLQSLLRDALELMVELGDANEHSDSSYWHLPSISPHWQNRGFTEWVTLIELLRDAWLAVRELDQSRAAHIAQEWFAQPYASFKRLALFVASQDGCVPSGLWVSWLLSDDRRWLWVADTMRECMRLLVQQGVRLLPDTQTVLESAILAGPPRELFRDGIEADEWRHHVDHSTWLRLAKLESSGVVLGTNAKERLAELSKANSAWQLAQNQSDEFSHWMSGTGDEDFEDSRQLDPAPRKRTELVEWLKRPQISRGPFYEDTWRETCRTRFFHSVLALKDLASEGLWPAERWREAFQAWSEEGRVLRSWRCVAPLVERMPDVEFAQVARAVAWWLDAAAKSIDAHEPSFLALCDRVLALEHEDGVQTDQPVTRAINHPIGHITQALISYWFRREPNDGDDLPSEIESFFTRLCDVTRPQYRHGRVILASRLIAVFRVDKAWTERCLLPLFDWDANPDEARATWEGFMWSPRLYRPLLIAFKKQFLATAQHYEMLGEHGRQFAAFLTYAALDPVESYTSQDFQYSIAALPQEGLHQVAQTMAQAQEGAGERREEYWKSRLQPFWQKIWPKDRRNASAAMTDDLARLSIAAGNEFPSALSTTLDWLLPMEHPGYVVRMLKKSGLPSRFPLESLQLLNAIIGDLGWPSEELRQCLNAIAGVAAHLKNDRQFVRLDEYCRSRGL